MSEEQRRAIETASGRRVREVVFAAPVAHERPLDGEIVELRETEMARDLWNGTFQLLESMDLAPDIKKAFERYAGHELDDQDPLIVLVR